MSYWHILQNKNRSCTCSEMQNPVPYFYKHSIESYATLPVTVANASKPQLLLVCRWCWVFTELTWNLSIRSKATWGKSFLMLLAYRKQIIHNQRKTVRRAVTTNVCWRKSSCELFPLATTHTKVANSGKMVIARYRIRYFNSSLLPSSVLAVIDKNDGCSNMSLLFCACNSLNQWTFSTGRKFAQVNRGFFTVFPKYNFVFHIFQWIEKFISTCSGKVVGKQ